MELDVVLVSEQAGFSTPWRSLLPVCSLPDRWSASMLLAISQKKLVTLSTFSCPNPPIPLVNIKFQRRRRSGNVDHRLTHRKHGIPHHHPLFVLHSRSGHPLFLGGPPTFRTDLCFGVGERSQRLPDRRCSDRFGHGKSPSAQPYRFTTDSTLPSTSVRPP